MAPIKFEEHIKDKLEQRTVAPSANAWSKLSEQLDIEQKQTKKTAFWWLGIAASITALVFVSINYFNNQIEPQVKEIIVKDDIKNTSTSKKDNDIFIKDKVEEKIADTKANSIKTEIEKPNQKFQKNKLISEPNTEAVAKVEKRQELITPIKPEQEFNSVVAELQTLKTETKNQLINQEVDSLLKLANRELLMDKALKKNTNVVDSNKLLQDVEEDMGQSFRTKIYETLKKGYKEVKEAVAQRNN